MTDMELAEEYYYRNFPVTLNIGEEERKQKVIDIFLAGHKASLERWLGEAKEIIKDLLSLKATVSTAEDIKKRFSVRERAEQFLKEE